ncbi:MAG: hypothetical protein JWN01_805 [Patescibacteria group bacterium]|nr:hypothetical protein [Patescibacteria group bacterium]
MSKTQPTEFIYFERPGKGEIFVLTIAPNGEIQIGRWAKGTQLYGHRFYQLAIVSISSVCFDCIIYEIEAQDVITNRTITLRFDGKTKTLLVDGVLFQLIDEPEGTPQKEMLVPFEEFHQPIDLTSDREFALEMVFIVPPGGQVIYIFRYLDDNSWFGMLLTGHARKLLEITVELLTSDGQLRAQIGGWGTLNLPDFRDPPATINVRKVRPLTDPPAPIEVSEDRQLTSPPRSTWKPKKVYTLATLLANAQAL